MAEQTGQQRVYDYLYSATGRQVHFNAHEIGRRAFSNGKSPLDLATPPTGGGAASSRWTPSPVSPLSHVLGDVPLARG